VLRVRRVEPGTMTIALWKLRLKVSGISEMNFES
jgi:hypothetical protein